MKNCPCIVSEGSGSTRRRRPDFPASLTDLHRLGKNVHGHDGSSRIVMVRKTDQRTFSCRAAGADKEPVIETVTRETIETFRGQRTECKITTEKSDCEHRRPFKTSLKRKPPLIDKSINASMTDIIKSSSLGRSPGCYSPSASLSRTLSHLSVDNNNDGTEGDFETDFLCAHNDYRRRHGVPPLELDRMLCRLSREWARYLAARNTLEHRKNSPHGENIFCVYSSDPNFTITGRAPVDEWYAESKEHPFGREPSNLRSGHFTQVVWQSSERLGVGVARSRHGSIYVVGNYSPAGNFLGNYAENVPPPLSTFQVDTKSECPQKTKDLGFGRFASDALRAHNEYRRKHGVPEMTLDKKLSAFAQEWADRCSRAGNMTHRLNNKYGENIFYIYFSDFSLEPSAKDTVKAWYDEIKDYTFGDIESINRNTLHFTQVVWRSSTRLGIGIAKNNKGERFIVANYHPRGNVCGQFVANVPAPGL